MINADPGTIFRACLVRCAHRLAHLIPIHAVHGTMNVALTELHRVLVQAKVESQP